MTKISEKFKLITVAEKTRKSVPWLFGNKKGNIQISGEEKKMERQIKIEEERAKEKEEVTKQPVPSTSKLQKEESFIYNLENVTKMITSGK